MDSYCVFLVFFITDPNTHLKPKYQYSEVTLYSWICKKSQVQNLVYWDGKYAESYRLTN